MRNRRSDRLVRDDLIYFCPSSFILFYRFNIRCDNQNIIIEVNYRNFNSVVCVPISITEGHCGSRSTDPLLRTHFYDIICRCPIYNIKPHELKNTLEIITPFDRVSMQIKEHKPIRLLSRFCYRFADVHCHLIRSGPLRFHKSWLGCYNIY